MPRPARVLLDVRLGPRRPRPEPRRHRTGPTARRRASSPPPDHTSTPSTPRTGKPIAGFGTRRPHRPARGARPRSAGRSRVRLTTPGVIYKDLLIVGGRVSEGLPASPGDIRAYDVRTGALRWAFHTIPHAGRAGLRHVAGATRGRTAAAPTTGPGWRVDERARHRLRADGIGGAPTSTAPTGRRQPVRQLAARARRRDRQARSGTSRRCITTSGIAISRRRPAS